MQIALDATGVAHLLASAIRAELQQIDDLFEFRFFTRSFYDDSRREVVATISEEHLNHVLRNLASLELVEETALAAEQYFEVLVRDESPFTGPRMREKVVMDEPEHGMKYTYESASDEYLVLMLWTFSNAEGAEEVFNSPSFRYNEREEFRDQTLSIFDVLKKQFRNFKTLKIQSARKVSHTEFGRFADAFVCELSFNLEIALVQQRSFEEVLRLGRLARCKRLTLADMTGPLRQYVRELVYHYQLAIAADNPLLQYISYYHIAEHFFEEVFSDELINRVTDRITRPDFSYRRKKDVQGLIKEITKAVRVRNETALISEQEGLRLTLVRFVDIEMLVDELNRYDHRLVPYYKTSKVPFAAAEEVELCDTDSSRCYKMLSARIYKIRNSLVHSKESDRSNFRPFVDDRILRREIPLMRFVSEQILINSSTKF